MPMSICNTLIKLRFYHNMKPEFTKDTSNNSNELCRRRKYPQNQKLLSTLTIRVNPIRVLSSLNLSERNQNSQYNVPANYVKVEIYQFSDCRDPLRMPEQTPAPWETAYNTDIIPEQQPISAAGGAPDR